MMLFENNLPSAFPIGGLVLSLEPPCALIDRIALCSPGVVVRILKRVRFLLGGLGYRGYLHLGKA